MSPLYCLTSDFYEESHSEQVNAMCESGVKLIQIRSKNLSKNQLFEEVSYASEICAKFGATLIVNDAIDVATAIADPTNPKPCTHTIGLSSYFSSFLP